MLADPLSMNLPDLATCDTAQVDAMLSHIESVMNTDYKAVIALSQQTLACSEELAYWRGISMSHYFAAWAHLRLNDYAAASKPAQQALMVAQEYDLAIQEAYACSALGAVYSYVGDEAISTEYFLKQLKIAEEHNHPLLTAYALGDLGSAYLEMGETDKGISLIEKSLKIFDDNNASLDKYLSLLNIADFRAETEDHSLAYTLYEEILELGQTHKITEAIISALNGMAYIKGKLQDFDKALELLEQSYVVATASDSLLTGEILVITGNIYCEQKRLDAAIEKYTQGLEIATRAENWQVMLDADSCLATLYETRGDYQKALQHYRAFQAAKEKSFNERSRSRMQILSALYETETAHKEAQINLLRSEAAERALSEYKQTEAERLEMERLRGSLDQERELAALKERILTRISHEFRTPLSIIRTSTELVTRYAAKLSEEKRQEYYDRISEQFAAIEKQLNDISAVLHAKSSRITGTRQHVNLAALSESAVQMARNQTKSSSKIELDLQAVNREIWVEQSLLQAILTHLLSNALKFSQEPVTLRLQIVHDILRVIVEDKGIGIPANEQAKVFEPLVRGTNIDEVRGSGLGLTIVRDYVDLLQGQIDLTSEVNKGTRVMVTIPLTAVPAEPV